MHANVKWHTQNGVAALNDGVYKPTSYDKYLAKRAGRCAHGCKEIHISAFIYPCISSFFCCRLIIPHVGWPQRSPNIFHFVCIQHPPHKLREPKTLPAHRYPFLIPQDTHRSLTLVVMHKIPQRHGHELAQPGCRRKYLRRRPHRVEVLADPDALGGTGGGGEGKELGGGAVGVVAEGVEDFVVGRGERGNEGDGEGVI
jgi:hypothetical protein